MALVTCHSRKTEKDLHYSTKLFLLFLVSNKGDALRDLIPFVQFKKHERNPRRSLAKACNFTISNTASWMFFTFFKLYKWYQIMLSVMYSYYSGYLK